MNRGNLDGCGSMHSQELLCLCEVWGFYTNVTEDAGVLVCDAVLLR